MGALELSWAPIMQANGKDGGSGGGIRHKLGSLFSPRGPPPATKGREDVDSNTFITADVLRVSGCGCGRGSKFLSAPQELEKGAPTQRRVRAMRELTEIVASKRLEEVEP